MKKNTLDNFNCKLSNLTIIHLVSPIASINRPSNTPLTRITSCKNSINSADLIFRTLESSRHTLSRACALRARTNTPLKLSTKSAKKKKKKRKEWKNTRMCKD